MPKINSIEFGSVTIDDKKYDQVLIIGDLVKERDYKKLKELFGTSHKIGDWEVTELLSDSPEIIIIGSGHDGRMEVEDNFLSKVDKDATEVIVQITPDAIRTYNEKSRIGNKVNALIHTTC